MDMSWEEKAERLAAHGFSPAEIESWPISEEAISEREKARKEAPVFEAEPIDFGDWIP